MSADLSVRNVVFLNDTALGAAGSAGQLDYGGVGAGGGMAVRAMNDVVTLNNVVFAFDTAQGGCGTSLGGAGLGGGFYAYQSAVSLTGVTFANGQAAGGTTFGSGDLPGMAFADGAGGGAYLLQSTAQDMNVITAAHNLAQGGNAPNGQAGGGRGGGLHFEESSVNGHDWSVHENTAQGGAGTAAGRSSGGGLDMYDSQGILDRGFVDSNWSYGGQGVGGTPNGVPQGGGIAFFNHSAAGLSANVVNFVIAGNLNLVANTSVGTLNGDGGGGGVSDQGENVGLYHCTIADNVVEKPNLHGDAVLVFGQGTPFHPTLTLQYDIIANEGSAVHGFGGSTIDETRNLFYSNGDDDNSGGATDGPDGHSQYNFSSANPNLNGDPKFAAPGDSGYNYNTLGGSAAIDQAVGSGAGDDAFNRARTGTPDIGAVEHQQPPSLAFSASTFTFNQLEDDTVTVVRGGFLGIDLAVRLTTADGTAKAGTDYQAVDTILRFAPGQTSASYTVRNLLPQLNNNSLSYQVRLSDPSDDETAFPAGPSATMLVYGGYADGVAEFDPSRGRWFLRGTANAGAALTFPFGGVGWTPLVGDWDGDGSPSLGAADPATETFYLRNTEDSGPRGLHAVPLRRARLDAGGWRLGREPQLDRRRRRSADQHLVSPQHQRRRPGGRRGPVRACRAGSRSSGTGTAARRRRSARSIPRPRRGT